MYNPSLMIKSKVFIYKKSTKFRFIIKQMKTLGQRRQINITLKQYMVNQSLKKRVESRSNSRQGKCQANPEVSNFGLIHNIQNLGRHTLIDEIKLFLADNITNQVKLGKILKMFDQLIHLYNQQLFYKSQQNQILIHQKKSYLSNLGKSERQMDTQPLETVKNNTFNFINEKIRKNSVEEDNRSRKPSVEAYKYRKSSFTSSEEIPNINILLETRNSPTDEKIRDMDTSETLFSAYNDKQNESLISIKLDQTTRDHDINEFTSLLASNARNNPLKSSRNNYNEEDKDNLRGTFQRKSKISNTNVMSRFQQFKIKKAL